MNTYIILPVCLLLQIQFVHTSCLQSVAPCWNRVDEIVQHMIHPQIKMYKLSDFGQKYSNACMKHDTLVARYEEMCVHKNVDCDQIKHLKDEIEHAKKDMLETHEELIKSLGLFGQSKLKQL